MKLDKKLNLLNESYGAFYEDSTTNDVLVNYIGKSFALNTLFFRLFKKKYPNKKIKVIFFNEEENVNEKYSIFSIEDAKDELNRLEMI